MTGTNGDREVKVAGNKRPKTQGEPEAKLKKEIGLWTLVALGAGGMIGSGIFALPAVMGAASGPALLLAILAAAIVMMFLAMAYAELGAAFPLTGGPYSLPRLALGDTGGFVMGWGYFLYAFIGTGAIIQIFIVYIGFWVPGLSNGQTLTWFGTAIAVAFLWVFTGFGGGRDPHRRSQEPGANDPVGDVSHDADRDRGVSADRVRVCRRDRLERDGAQHRRLGRNRQTRRAARRCCQGHWLADSRDHRDHRRSQRSFS